MPPHSDDLELPNHLCSLPALAVWLCSVPPQHKVQMLCPVWGSGSAIFWLAALAMCITVVYSASILLSLLLCILCTAAGAIF
jgi:hypothetical protein